MTNLDVTRPLFDYLEVWLPVHVSFPFLGWVVRKRGCRGESIPRMCCIISVAAGSRIMRCVVLLSRGINLTFFL